MIAVSIDGVLVPPEQAAISVFDRGLLFGDGVFEVLRTWDGIAVDLAPHLDRLYDAAQRLQIKAIERELLADSVRRAVTEANGSISPTAKRKRNHLAPREFREPVTEANGSISPAAKRGRNHLTPREFREAVTAGEHRIRIMLTRGPGPLIARPATLGPGRAIVIVEPLPPQPVQVTLAVVDWPLPRRVGAGMKTLSYLDHLLARELAAIAGADEAIRLDADGHVIECASSNIFAVIGRAPPGNLIVTPAVDTGALPGITRARVLAICGRLGLPTQIRPLPLHELQAADEMFVTSALRGVVAVTRLDGASRTAGPLTARLADEYERAMTET